MKVTSSSTPRSCEHCGTGIDHLRSDATICGSKPCRNSKQQHSYHSRLKKKTCARCGAECLLKRQENRCEPCSHLPRVLKFQEIEQSILCRKCGSLIETVRRKKTKTSDGLRTGLCDSCRSIGLKTRSEIKKGDRNPNWKGGYVYQPRGKGKIIKRMIESNPMMDPTVAAKVRTTKRNRIESGELTYKSGMSHHLWKGNRKPSFVLRSRLLNWTKTVMTRDGFRCTDCGAKGSLEVHHVRPFKDIVDGVIKSTKSAKLGDMDVNSEEFARFADLVVSEHRLSDGVTYCKPCHARNDSRRRI